MRNFFHIFIILSAIFFFSLIAQAEMRSPNYSIPADSVSIGGDRQDSTNYSGWDLIGELATGDSRSVTYITDAGFLAMVGNEAVLTFNVTDPTADLGTLVINDVKADTATFTAATTSKSGYVIEFFGNPLSSPSHTLTPLSSGDISRTGNEQFGFNLMENSNPTIGHIPVGGNGQAAVGYGTTNQYKFSSGDIIAQTTQASVYTNYTASFIGNITNISDAGDYATNLTVVITGKF